MLFNSLGISICRDPGPGDPYITIYPVHGESKVDSPRVRDGGEQSSDRKGPSIVLTSI